ncbi:MAG: hypothetical protein DRQ88_10475 [Epsilonproteobacteria bacterium]|nr:MAG: hypothetical protein DRQ88_10475 [Campylobacterota bacterium]
MSFLLIIAFPAQSISEKGQILQVSKSGRSMIWARGVFEGIRKGTTGVFVYKNEKVAIGEVVRVLPEKSYWILRDIKRPEALKNNQTLSFFADENFLRGRIPEKIKRKKVVLSKGQKVSDFENELRRGGVPDRVVKLEDDHREGPALKVSPQREDFTVETIDYTTWLDDGLQAVEEYDEVLENKKIGEFKTPVPESIIQKKSKAELIGSTANGVIKRTNYKKMESLDRKRMIDKKFVRMREREGPLWSADLDDRQLRRYVLETGMVEEKKRQEFAMENRFMDEFVLRFNKSFPRAQNAPFDSNQADGYSWSVGYELHLMRLTRVLDSFSVEAFFEYGNGYYEMGAENIRSNQFALNLSASWYFLNLPSNLGKFLGHLGVGGRLGEAYLDAASFTKSYNYQLRSFPWYYLEFKYRFDDGEVNNDLAWGLSFMFSYLNTELTVMETLLDDIRGNINMDEVRWSIGLNFTI